MFKKIYDFNNYEINELGEVRKLKKDGTYKNVKCDDKNRVDIWEKSIRVGRFCKNQLLKDLFGIEKKKKKSNVTDMSNEKWKVLEEDNTIYISNLGRLKKVTDKKERLINSSSVRSNRNRINGKVYFRDYLLQKYWKPFENLDGEEWKLIEDCNNLFISNKGRVKRDNYKGVIGFEKILSTTKLPLGYEQFKYTTDKGETKRTGVHRLVGMAFIPNPDNKPCIDHIDTNPSNNSVDNLRWVTHKENMNNPTTLDRLRENCSKMTKNKQKYTKNPQ